MVDAYMVQSDPLLVCRPKGTLDGEIARRLVEVIEIKEADLETGFNRFCDLTHLEGINLSIGEIESMATRRRDYNPNLFQVKSAFLATSPLALSIVCLYKTLLESPRIKVRGFKSLEEAAVWLGVNPDKLTL